LNAVAVAAAPNCVILHGWEAQRLVKRNPGLLDRYAFKVCTDEDIATLGGLLSSDVARATRLMKHLRIVVADRDQED
jgi:hypothetical protein